MVGSLIKLYINGHYIYEYNDIPSLTSGFIGVYSCDAAREISDYDNVVLEDLSLGKNVLTTSENKFYTTGGQSIKGPPPAK